MRCGLVTFMLTDRPTLTQNAASFISLRLRSAQLGERLRSCYPGRHRSDGCLLPTENPHEEQLDDVRVHKQELRASFTLGTSNGVRVGTANRWVVGGVWEENVF